MQCIDEKCYDSIIDALVYQLKVNLSRLSDNLVKQEYYGFSCDKSAKSKADILLKYLSILEDEQHKIALGGKSCLSNYNRQKLAEKVRQKTRYCNIYERVDVIKDKSGLANWEISNPFCVARERWEKIAKTICAAFNLEIAINAATNGDALCNISLEIVKESISCDLIVAISVYHEMCELNFSVSRTEQECALDFEMLLEKTDCDLSFDAYKALIECNLSFDVLKAAYDAGCTFNIGDPISLTTSTGITYELSELKLKNKPDIEAINSLGINLTNSEFVKDPEMFMKKLKQDYGE
jgi:hypothetical protein